MSALQTSAVPLKQGLRAQTRASLKHTRAMTVAPGIAVDRWDPVSGLRTIAPNAANVGFECIPPIYGVALQNLRGHLLPPWDPDTRGPLSPGAMLDKLRAEGYHGVRYRFPPGSTFPDHTHGVDKKDAILAGQFLFRMGGQEVVLTAGDCVEVPAGAVHYARVVGSEPVDFVDGTKV